MGVTSSLKMLEERRRGVKMKIAALPKWQFAAIMQLKVLIPIEYLLCLVVNWTL